MLFFCLSKKKESRRKGSRILFFSELWKKFLKIFGDIKVFPKPLFLLYHPKSYKISGEEMREVIEILQPGDILIRGYKHYLDGFFIPGEFSHAGLYLGNVPEKSDVRLPENSDKFYREGKQVVIHAMAQGVFMEDVLNFCRCDSMVILRRRPDEEHWKIRRSNFRSIYFEAMQHLGKEYDFQFDFASYNDMSCTKLVYRSLRNLMGPYDVRIKTRAIWKFKKRVLVPDDFITDKFNIVWSSSSVSKGQLESILEKNRTHAAKTQTDKKDMRWSQTF